MVVQLVNRERSGFAPGNLSGRPLAFIDVEASGLTINSWPIEVGWAKASGSPTAMFISPDDAWSDDGWDETAQALHGISREQLFAEGASPIAVARRLNAELQGCAVVSDCVDWDGFWLARLFHTAKVRPAFDLESFDAVIGPTSREDAARLFAAAAASSNAFTAHRAACDVARLRRAFELSHAAV